LYMTMFTVLSIHEFSRFFFVILRAYFLSEKHGKKFNNDGSSHVMFYFEDFQPNFSRMC
jgi:hypothetical protein